MEKKTLLIIVSIIMLIGFTSCDPVVKSIAQGVQALDPVTDPQVHEKYFEIDETGTASLKTDQTDLPVSLLIPQKVGEVDVKAIENCSGSFESVVIPGHVKTICEDAFNGCTNLKNVVIEDGVEEIECFAFTGCSALSQVVINSFQTEIDIDPFAFPMNDSIKFWHGTQEYANFGEFMEAMYGN